MILSRERYKRDIPVQNVIPVFTPAVQKKKVHARVRSRLSLSLQLADGRRRRPASGAQVFAGDEHPSGMRTPSLSLPASQNRAPEP